MLGTLVAFLAIIAAAVVFAFFHFPPKFAQESQLRVFNWSVTGACVLICAGWVINIGAVFSEPGYEEFLKPFAFAGAFAIVIVFYLIMFILRNFWIFKPPRLPGTGWF